MQVAPPPPLGAMCMPLSRFLNKAGFIFEHLEHIKIISLKQASQEFEPIELTVNTNCHSVLVAHTFVLEKEMCNL